MAVSTVRNPAHPELSVAALDRPAVRRVGPVLVARPVGRDRTARVATTSGLADLEALGDEWAALADHAQLPTAAHSWASACAHSFHPEGGLQVVTVRRGGRLVAVAPLAPGVEPGVLEPLGMPQLDEPYDFPCVDDAARAALASALARIDAPIVLRRVPARSPLAWALAQAYALRGIVVARPATASPTLPLDSGWLAPEGALPPRRRSNLRRARRRAEAIGELCVDLLAPRPAEVAAVLAEAFAVEAAGWRGRCGSALGSDPLAGAFMRRYALAAAAEGSLRVGFLRIDGVPVATQIAVEHDRRLWLLKMGFDERYARCSPGSLLLVESLRDATARGLHACELLGQLEPRTQTWTKDVRELVALQAIPARPRSGGELVARLGSAALRGVRRRRGAAAR